MKLKDRCIGCKKFKWFSRKREIQTKVGIAISKDPLCGKCYKDICKALIPR